MFAVFIALALASTGTDPAAVRERIEQARTVAEAIVVDGQDRDWSGLFTMRGPGDIRGISVAPTAEVLLVRLRMADAVDVRRAVLISLDAGGGHPIDTIFKVQGQNVGVNWHDDKRFQPLLGAIAVRNGPVLELRVPWSILSSRAPQDHPIHTPRSWLRVRAQLARAEGQPVSPPLAVASYRLTSPPPPLDDPGPPADLRPVQGLVPLEGTWFVTQGAMSASGSHQDTWAYDLVVRDRSHRSRLGKRLEETLSWGQPVVAPGRGTVRLAIDEHPDRALDGPKGTSAQANKVIIDLDDRTRFRVGHLQQGSVTVSKGDRVAPGQVLGRVGNSGISSGPHAHVVYTHADGRPAPARWTGITVQLNPVEDDPWARRPVGGWEPQGGWFVTVDPRADASGTAPLRPAPLPDPSAQDLQTPRKDSP